MAKQGRNERCRCGSGLKAKYCCDSPCGPSPDAADRSFLARAIRDLGPENVVVKGGHLENIAADLLYDGREFTEFRAERIDTRNTHGTGCIFASAIAANLAHKKTVLESVTAAKDFITAAIRAGLAIGKGYGPADPMAMLYHRAGLDG